MGAIRAVPQIMVLAEESPSHLLFRFRGGLWAIGLAAFVMLFTSIILLPVLLKGRIADARGLLALVGGFDLLLLYAIVFSLNCEQWLRIDGLQRRARFFWKSFYGVTDWEIGAAQCKGVRVFSELGHSNWAIMLSTADGTDLFLGDNEFGAFDHERASALAGKVGRMLGVPVTGALPGTPS